MRVIVPVVSPEHVCIRYRVSAYAEMLASAGYHLDYRLIPAGLWGRLRLARQCAGADAVWVQRWLPSLPVARLLRRCARRLIFDFDDAIWQRDSYHRRGPYSRRNLARFRRMVQLADLVLAGNDYLADHARRYAAAAATVHRLPTVVDPARYRVATHDRPNTGPIRLVWLGSASTLQGLTQCRDLLEAVGRAVPGTELTVICDVPLTLTHLPARFVPWSCVAEQQVLPTCDIGIAWLPDDAWSRGKCGLKVLQYMAAGLPVVANRVGVQPEMVRHEETGLLADSSAEWCQAIARLGADAGLRRRLGWAGRERVEREYSVAYTGRRLVELLQRINDCPSPAKTA